MCLYLDIPNRETLCASLDIGESSPPAGAAARCESDGEARSFTGTAPGERSGLPGLAEDDCESLFFPDLCFF